MRSSIWKKGLICLSAVMLLECPVGALPGTAYTAKAEETDDKTDTSNIKSILLIGQDKQEGQSRQRSDSMILATLDKDQKTISLTSFMRESLCGNSWIFQHKDQCSLCIRRHGSSG